jgi:hypothetical protein
LGDDFGLVRAVLSRYGLSSVLFYSRFRSLSALSKHLCKFSIGVLLEKRDFSLLKVMRGRSRDIVRIAFSFFVIILFWYCRVWDI